jgi:hypothetical protein
MAGGDLSEPTMVTNNIYWILNVEALVIMYREKHRKNSIYANQRETVEN